ncbi:hypothetical protein MA16_Dca018097 [Dendrobium catenatum]|uniref:Uncharacterized protein n=1 Tax=Dendrobium catenatum TaxID=906689 RepID=A0A2I0XI21_9ASPA|nr:hypothetical protein MA16_Dca018097 [Dendrobium catenatum]
MVKEYQQVVSTANHGGVRDHQTLYPHFGLACSPHVLVCLPFILCICQLEDFYRICLVTLLREYQGVDPYFDSIARQYNDIVKKLEGMLWTIHQVEMDLKCSLDRSATLICFLFFIKMLRS